jgi:ferredoxin-NADP reductase
VVDVVAETPSARTIVLEPTDWPGHRAGQHLDVRLTAADGYQAQRSYSIASGPEDARVAITVERLDDGEVSPYLVDVVEPGDELELRGPIGGYFVWDATQPGPLLLIAGGSGIVPLRAMLRHWLARDRPVPVRILYSARSPERVIYAAELEHLAAEPGADVRIALTREWPADWPGPRGRVGAALLGELAWPPGEAATTYVCGPSAFVETVARELLRTGQPPGRIKLERFGPSGR